MENRFGDRRTEEDKVLDAAYAKMRAIGAKVTGKNGTTMTVVAVNQESGEVTMDLAGKTLTCRPCDMAGRILAGNVTIEV